MKILKKGKDKSQPNFIETFICSKCGCEFEASEDEYWTESNWTTASLGDSSIAYSYTNYEQKHCNCPQCHAKCYTTGKLISNPTITLSGTEKTNIFDKTRDVVTL